MLDGQPATHHLANTNLNLKEFICFSKSYQEQTKSHVHLNGPVCNPF